MSQLLTYIIALFAPVVNAIETKLVGAFGAIVTEQPEDQQKILHDSIDQFTKDRAAGKSYGEAAADALTTFYQGEAAEGNKVTTQLFNAFLAATE